MLARFEGIPLRTGIELSLMTRYFIFQVIHGFLIVTLASGLMKSIPALANNPSSAVTLLATQLPAASTFFLTYFVTTSFAGAAGALLQIAKLVIYYVKLVLLGSTPRSVFNVKYSMSTVAWGTLVRDFSLSTDSALALIHSGAQWPSMTLLTVIGLSYSVIAPLVCGFAFVAFALFWFVYKVRWTVTISRMSVVTLTLLVKQYLFLLAIDTPPETETGGLFYPKAITHIFVGIYIELLCLCGLFFLAQDADGNQSAIPQGAIMVVLIVITALYHIVLIKGYHPLIAYLPLSVAPKMAEAQGYTDGYPSNRAPRAEKDAQSLAQTATNQTPREKDEPSTFLCSL